ncbi:hypothetical protein DWU98_02900 [Dyella monticola]|uniref:DUF1579 domain-containing protein n=1 Tax=Dyella monticola TaxID=1927958 RepID=A0A370X9N3_9GAMM|nr:hypothetical protein DWU98_02900 [Dyella monticola]
MTALCTVHSNAQSSTKTPMPADAVSPAPRDGQHDFDFEFGKWNTHVSMLAHPLTGSKTWVDYTGITVDHKIWNGVANLVELDMKNASSHLMLASLRLYNPATHQWGLYVVNSRSGTLGTPTLGGFAHGRGVFYDKETWDGKPIVVRFVITPRSADAIHFEQAFSADEGKTWETNWIADDTRIAQ